MRGRDHFLLSAALALPVAYALTGPALAAPTALAVGACALLPDLDHDWALANKPLRRLGLAGVLRSHIGHRSPLTHSLAAGAGWALWWLLLAVAVRAPWPLPLWAGAVVLAGAWLHVLEDWLPWGSRSGVPLLAPFRRGRQKLRLHRPALRPLARRRPRPVRRVADPAVHR